MKRLRLLPLLSSTLLTLTSSTPAHPASFRETQPDGSLTPPLFLRGDASNNFLTDEDGRRIVRDGDGWFVPADARRRNLRSKEQVFQPQQSLLQSQPQFHPNRRRLTSGTFHNLVLLLRFSSHSSRSLPPRSHYDLLYNAPTSQSPILPTGSVRTYYHDNSYGAFNVKTTVLGWITLSESEEYYSNGDYGFTKFKEGIVEALEVLKNKADFDLGEFDANGDGLVDGFGILHSGYGAEFGGADCFGASNVNRIWSHKGGVDWIGPNDIAVDRYYVSSGLRNKCGSDIVRMGVICHELGHYLGLPDLYDATFDGSGIGAYDVMSQSWGFDGTGMYPPLFSAWSKVSAGWVAPVVIEEDGTYEIAASHDSDAAYRIDAGFPQGEYLLIENRQPKGFDSKLPHGGIAIWHIDENAKQDVRGYPDQDQWPENGKHYRIALLSADGNYDLERGVNQGDVHDLWHASSGNVELRSGGDKYPNTDTYQGGVVNATGIRIHGFSVNKDVMSFKVQGIMIVQNGTGAPSKLPSAAPSHHPATDAPTTQPSRQPSNSPVTQAPITSGPSKDPTSSPAQPTGEPTNSPSRQPVSVITTTSPTRHPTTKYPTSESERCADRCFEPLPSSECPANAAFVNCKFYHFRRNGEVLVPRLSLVEVWRLFGRDPEQHPVVVAAFSIVVGLGKAQGDEAGGRSKIPLAPIVLVLYIILQFSSAVEQPTISDSPVSLLPSPLSQNFVGAVATSISSLALGYSSRRFWFVPSWLHIHGPLHHCMSVWVCSHGLPSTTVNSTLWFGISSFLAKCWAALYSYNTSFAWKNGSMYLLQKWCLQCWWSLGFCGFIAITACGCVPSITVYIRLLWRTTSCCACMATHLLLISLPCGVLRLFSVVWFCDYFDARKWWKCLRSYVDATLASIPWSACMQRVSLSPMDIVFGVLWVVGSVTIWLLHQCLALLPHHQLRIRQLTFMQSPSSSLILSRRCHTHLISPPCLLWSLIQSRLLLSRPLLDDPCRLQQSLLHQRETCCELVKNIWLRVYGVGIFATMPLFWLKNIDDGLAFLLQWLVLVQLMLHFPMLVWQHTNTTTTDLLVQPAFTSTMFFPDMWSYLWLTATFLFRVVISVNLVLMRVPPWCDICQFLSAHVFCVSKDYALWVSLPSSQNMMHRIGVYWLITGLLPTFTSILWRYTSSRSRHFPVLALLRVLASHDLLLQMMITHQHRPITSCPCQLSLLRQIDIVINTFLSSTSPEGVVTQTPEGVVTLLFFVFGAINAMVLNVPFYHNIGSRGSVGHTEKHSHVYLTSMYSTITLWQYQTKSNTKMKCYLAMIAKEFGFYNQHLSSAC